MKKQPDAWIFGFFDIPPTEDWETYKAAYLKQMIEKLHRNQETVYFGKADATKALEKVEDIEKWIKEKFQHPLIDR